jgi:hypothetical protein
MICELVVDAFGALSVRATEEVCRVGGFQRRWVWVDARALMVGLIGAAPGADDDLSHGFPAIGR